MILRFTVECEPHEEKELKDYQDGPRWKALVGELAAWLRKEIKYSSRPEPELERVRDKLFELIVDEGLELE